MTPPSPSRRSPSASSSPAPAASTTPTPRCRRHQTHLAATRALRARAWRALARLDARSHPTDASAELLEALKLSPETPDDTLLTAQLAQATPGNSADAEAAYRHLLATRPDDPAAAAALAHLLLTQKRPAEAEPILVAALAAHPATPP